MNKESPASFTSPSYNFPPKSAQKAPNAHDFMARYFDKGGNLYT